jgi:hypothetical protein
MIAARICLILVALYWTLVLGSLALVDDYLPAQLLRPSRVSYVLLSISSWAAAWAVGRTFLAGRIVRWMSAFGLVGALYLWQSIWWYRHVALWSMPLHIMLLLGVLILLIVPELHQLRHWATTKRLTADIALALMLSALGVGGYFLYQQWATTQNMNLRAAVVAELEKIELPPGSRFVYEEVEANRSCNTASISRVFASEIDPIEICMLVTRPLATREWEIVTACQSATHPFTSRFGRLVVRMPSGSVLQLEAEPKDSRGPHLMLSTHGDSKAIPLAREAGSSFFTIRLDSWEDPERMNRLCPDPSRRCRCRDSTLSAWRFADGRHLIRSD